ncbi:BTAD domain-containing putative transcriptional regulator [Candidatus Mycobacterium wuenschmannii]|uniref:BTAD domain-containing putative transcriptional regulator n=1 Tax=Candidatus Mycobacterium wuenschmannii TaxID=3027808 RepID=A0ABY8VYB9_9MYCO|nr:AfsR/SARP family transcriptional regulator [Candidatus Mycobacterium wuenschmannii]WIM88625.1 BTAD domain-containing putative transcriptional regulator [Candidatus Mycobacterium wuenschmannii]
MVEYQLSGAVEARVGGALAPLGGPKQRCVLAVLLANHGTVVSVDRLIDAVWEDKPPPKALASLRAYVTNLRRILPVSTDTVAQPKLRLASRAYGYQLTLLDDDSVDLHRFETLVKEGRAALVRGAAAAAFDKLGTALTSWRGDPFGEFTHRDFAHADATRYIALRHTAIEARFDAALQSGDGGDLVPEIEAAIAADSTEERLWGHLMVALYRAGRTSDAIRAFDRARATLDRELGTAPGDGLQTLYRKICDKATDLHFNPPAEPPAVSPGSDPQSQIPFVGRNSELESITAALGNTRAGTGGLILLTGESGIGKTALAQAVSTHARKADMAIAWAAHPPGVRLPLMWTWIQLLRRLGDELGQPGRNAVRRVAPGVVDALVPEWTERDAINSGVRAAATGFALIEGVVSALCELSAIRPLLLVLDDLHLADFPSGNALSLLSAQLGRAPIQVIGNWTYFGSGRPMNRPTFERLVRLEAARSIHLDGIGPAAAATLVDALAGTGTEGAVSQRVWNRTGGNPLYIRELVSVLVAHDRLHDASDGHTDDVSAAVAGMVGQRLGRLDRPSRRALAAAAVIGAEFDIADLADVVDLSVSTVQARLRPAYETGLLDEVADRPGCYRFGHGLLHDAVLTQVPGSERAAVHAAIAAHSAASIATAAYEDVISVADHAWRAGTEINLEIALEIYETAIQRGLARSAYDDIAILAGHALQVCRKLPPKPEPLQRQASLWLHLAGAHAILDGQNSPAAAAAVQRAFEIGEHASGKHYHGAVAMQCYMLCVRGRLDEAQALASGLVAQYAATGDPDVGVSSHFVQVMLHTLRGEHEAQESVAGTMMARFPPPETVADPLVFFHPRVYCWLSLGRALLGDRAGAHRQRKVALELAQSRRAHFDILAAKLVRVEIDAILGVTDGTVAAAEEVYQEMMAAGSPQWAACARMIGEWARTLSGEGGDRDAAFEAFRDYTHDGSMVMTPFFLALIADIENHHGHVDHAQQLLERAQAVANATGEHIWDEQLARRLAVSAAT